ncbi:MAG: MlaD family protein [Planctomycetota bacterium]
MDENKLRFGVGVLVISAIGIGIILTLLFGAFPSVLQRDYTLNVVFPSAEGIGINAPVYRDGVRIGRVSSIALRNEGDGGVLVTLAMDASKPIIQRYLPRISPGNPVTGEARLEFVRAENPELETIWGTDRSIFDEPYGDGDYFAEGRRDGSLLDMQADLTETFQSIQAAGESIAAAGESVNTLAEKMSEVLGGSDPKLNSVTDRAISALEEFENTMVEIRTLVSDAEMQKNLRVSLEQLPVVLDEAKTAFESADKSLKSFERAGNQFEKVGVVAEDAVSNIQQITEPLANQSDVFVESVMRTLTRLEGTLAEAEEFSRALNNNEGTLRRLLEDDELYWQVRRTVDNVEQATARIRPILDDVRIFTDKIARDPRELGVRGAISRRPSGAGIK